MALIQVRFNLGSSKVALPDAASNPTLLELKRIVSEKMHIPIETMVLSRDMGGSDVIQPDSSSLSDLGIKRGDVLYIAGRYERKKVEVAYVTNGVLTPAGEYIVKCPEVEAISDTFQADVGNATSRNDRNTDSPGPGDSVANTKLTHPHGVATANIKPQSEVTRSNFGGDDELDDATAAAIQAALDEDRQYNSTSNSVGSGGDAIPLSPEVRAPDSVRRMNLLGGDDMTDHVADVPRMYSYTYIGTDFARPPPRPSAATTRSATVYDTRYDGMSDYSPSRSNPRQRRPLASLQFDDAPDALGDATSSSHLYNPSNRRPGAARSSDSGAARSSYMSTTTTTTTSIGPTPGANRGVITNNSNTTTNSHGLSEGIPFSLPPGANVRTAALCTIISYDMMYIYIYSVCVCIAHTYYIYMYIYI
jgi:hypothetical protein